MEVLLLIPMLFLPSAFLVYIATARRQVVSPAVPGLWKELALQPQGQSDGAPILARQTTTGSVSAAEAQRLTQELAELRAKVDDIAGKLDQLSETNASGVERKAA